MAIFNIDTIRGQFPKGSPQYVPFDLPSPAFLAGSSSMGGTSDNSKSTGTTTERDFLPGQEEEYLQIENAYNNSKKNFINKWANLASKSGKGTKFFTDPELQKEMQKDLSAIRTMKETLLIAAPTAKTNKEKYYTAYESAKENNALNLYYHDKNNNRVWQWDKKTPDDLKTEGNRGNTQYGDFLRVGEFYEMQREMPLFQRDSEGALKKGRYGNALPLALEEFQTYDTKVNYFENDLDNLLGDVNFSVRESSKPLGDVSGAVYALYTSKSTSNAKQLNRAMESVFTSMTGVAQEQAQQMYWRTPGYVDAKKDEAGAFKDSKGNWKREATFNEFMANKVSSYTGKKLIDSYTSSVSLEKGAAGYEADVKYATNYFDELARGTLPSYVSAMANWGDIEKGNSKGKIEIDKNTFVGNILLSNYDNNTQDRYIKIITGIVKGAGNISSGNLQIDKNLSFKYRNILSKYDGDELAAFPELQQFYINMAYKVYLADHPKEVNEALKAQYKKIATNEKTYTQKLEEWNKIPYWDRFKHNYLGKDLSVDEQPDYVDDLSFVPLNYIQNSFSKHPFYDIKYSPINEKAFQEKSGVFGTNISQDKLAKFTIGGIDITSQLDVVGTVVPIAAFQNIIGLPDSYGKATQLSTMMVVMPKKQTKGVKINVYDKELSLYSDYKKLGGYSQKVSDFTDKNIKDKLTTYGMKIDDEVVIVKIAYESYPWITSAAIINSPQSSPGQSEVNQRNTDKSLYESHYQYLEQSNE